MTISDIVQHMNKEYREEIIKEYKAEENSYKHVVIPNGVSVYEKPIKRPGKKGFCSMEDLQKKGIDLFVDSIPRILKNHPDARIKIVGGDKNNWFVQKYKNRLEKNLINYFNNDSSQVEKLMKKVKFLGWITDRKKNDRQYDWTDCVVIPSEYESFCLTACEALSHKRIPILTKTKAMNDLYHSKGIAIEIPLEFRTPEGLATVINKTLSKDKDPSIDKIAEIGRNYIEKFYTIEKMIENQLELFRKILGEIKDN